MGQSLTETDQFLIQGEEVEAHYTVEDLRGMEAFKAFCEIYSIKMNNEPVSEEDFDWMAENVKEQVRFHQYCKASKNYSDGCGRDQYLSMQD